MKLINAFLFTAVIVVVFWLIALLQPSLALADSDAEVPVVKEVQSKVQNKEGDKPVKVAGGQSNAIAITEMKLAGITEKTSLAFISKLWQRFSNKHALNNLLKKQPDRIYVWYREFSSDFDSATVTIGYDKSMIRGQYPLTVLPRKDYQPLLAKGKYSDTQMTDSWQKIDYSKAPQSILEIHYLSAQGEVAQTEILIAYQ